VLIALLITPVVLIKPATAEEPGYQTISVQEANQMIQQDPSIIIIDVRNRSEYIYGHLYGAQLIPLYQLENRTIQLQDHVNDKIIVYCKAGSRSASACEILAENNFTQVYNMAGGITAWMEANYPIYTSYHHVNVDVIDQQTIAQIEPLLLYMPNCSTCQSQPCSGATTSTTENVTTIEQDGNHSVIQIDGTVNGTSAQYTIDKTILWNYNETGVDYNKTVTFTSALLTMGNTSIQTFGLIDSIQNTAYNLTILTVLRPLDSGTYNSSYTSIEYTPAEGKQIISTEQYDFNTPVTLSQLYASIGNATAQLATLYGADLDQNLHIFDARYQTIAVEAVSLSSLVETNISQYNYQILTSTATLVDLTYCDACAILCPLAIVAVDVGCWALCFFGVAPVCTFCVEYFDVMQWLMDSGCLAICAYICSQGSSQSPYWVSSIQAYSWYGSAACHVWNPDNLNGANSDGNYAQIYAGNYGDQAMIVGYMNENAYGNIYLYGYSASGYYSHLYVYVSPNNSNWYQVTSTEIDPSSAYSINCGYYSSTFRYIAIVAYDDWGLSANLFIDAVSVVP
jgi:rhodanese-related sulfurtransferase